MTKTKESPIDSLSDWPDSLWVNQIDDGYLATGNFICGYMTEHCAKVDKILSEPFDGLDPINATTCQKTFDELRSSSKSSGVVLISLSGEEMESRLF